VYKFRRLQDLPPAFGGQLPHGHPVKFVINGPPKQLKSGPIAAPSGVKKQGDVLRRISSHSNVPDENKKFQ
jgi:hypothetical protein